ncbi:MAG: LytTR family transcriptional regulator [Tannerellaceae bacterium]|nr:LytTR family transcriptional regulator [Tannerellaceae bacterium]
MDTHPFRKTILHGLACLLLFLGTALLTAFLIRWYQEFPWNQCLWQGFINAAIWSILFYYGWYLSLYIKYLPAKAVSGILLECLHLTVCFLLFVTTGWIEEAAFLYQVPLLFVIGMLGWIIMLQWYATQIPEEPVVQTDLPALPEEETKDLKEVIQHISVKDGAHIHIIPMEELFFIQACGDYVNIFTAGGQFIKEQTMKSLEASLPVTFIRIHRSTIINSSQLSRIELFGKESYHVLLKNGTSLKASLTGYKLLKSRLNL